MRSVIGVQTVPDEETHRYGIVDPSVQMKEDVIKLIILLRNLNKEQLLLILAIMGRYIFTPEIFMFLEKQETGAGGEIQLTDAIQKLNEIQRCVCL